MSTREDAKHKFCIWYQLVRKLSTNPLLNDKTVDERLTIDPHSFKLKTPLSGEAFLYFRVPV
jgi:hypothetical protein